MARRGDVEHYKIKFSGTIVSVQPRTTVWRYLLDNRTHREIGFNIFMTGIAPVPYEEDTIAERDFSVAISEMQFEKLQPRIGDTLQGTAWTEKYPEFEYADFYRAGALKIEKSGDVLPTDGPPWVTDFPKLSTYAMRGARMLDVKCYKDKSKCFLCKWATMASVSIEYDWGKVQKFRFESFCYGPLSCKYYAMGKKRPVSYKGMGTMYDEGWLDEICVMDRNPDDD